MNSANASWLGIAVLTLMSTTGCEVITEIDRNQIDQGTGGSTSSSSSSSSGSMAECTEATVDTDCPDPGNECLVRACVDSKCAPAPVAQGTPVANNKPGDCQVSFCDGNGAVTTQNDDIDVPNDGLECTNDSCSNGIPTFTNVAVDSPCGAGGALYCDGNGACVGCTGDAQCGQASACATPVCVSGQCETNFTQIGTPTANQTAGDCQQEQCDGLGATKVVTDGSDFADDNNACTADTCSGTTPTHTNLASGAACTDGALGQVCNGAGMCVECLTGANCTSKVCVAQACAAPTCTDGVMNDVETDADCGGGTCPACDNGKNCSQNSDCTSTVCASGVCAASLCPDNRITGNEGCDDGNTTPGDGCSAACAIETGWECLGEPSVCTVSCADGGLDPDETCDDGNTIPGDGCSATCAIEPGYSCTGTPSVCIISCGEGTISGSEACDDGNLTNGDGCSDTCSIEPGYDCTGIPSVCGPLCGDTVIIGGETCDDGNTDNGDCCSSACALEAGCEIEPNDTDVTANAHSAVFVSDKVKAFIDPSGDIDYFSVVVPPGMNGDLAIESMDGPLGSTCSSLLVDTNVTVLDSGGSVLGVNDDISGTDYCSILNVASLSPGTYYIEVTASPFVPTATFDYTLQAVLTLGTCGSGTIEAGEGCDDGNLASGDGCSSVCALEPGFQCSGAPSVCVDDDECSLGTHDCVAGATCANTPGSFTCTCPANLGGDGKTSGMGCASGIYYAFDGAGTTVPNLAVTPPLNATSATIIGGQTQGGVGKCGTALNGIGGTGNTTYVDTTWPTYLSGSWTISFWTANMVPPAPPNPDYLFGDVTAGAFRCFTGGLAGDNNVMLRGTGITDVTLTGATNVAPTMATFVYDASLNDIKGYINGVLAETVAQAGPLSFVGTGPFKVGGYGTTAPSFTNGAQLDEFRIYYRALNATEVADLWTNPVCTP